MRRVVVVVEVAPGVVVVVGAGVVLEVVVGPPAIVVEVVDDAGVVVVDAPGALVDVVVLTGALEVVVEVAPGVVVVVGAGVVLEVVVGPPAIVVEVVDDAGVVVVDATGALVEVVVLTGVIEVVVVRGAAVVVVVVAAGQPALKIRDLHEAWSFPCFTSSLVTWAAQLTYAPWLRAGQHWACAAASASGTPRPLHAAAKPRSEAPRRTARARKPASPIRVPMKSPIRGVGGASFVSPGSWRAVRRGCSYARMRSDATSPRTPSARPVFPSPSCWSATRSISVVPLTVQGYFERWVADKVPPEVRRAQANDYRRHMKGYVLPVLGDLPLEAVTARDILGLRTELRQRGLSLKYVKNVLAGSFKAMLRDARLIDRVLAAEPFEGVTWPRVEVPEADPFAPDERQRILAWFRDRRLGFSAGQAKEGLRVRPHPPYHAYVHTLFWTGM